MINQLGQLAQRLTDIGSYLECVEGDDVESNVPTYEDFKAACDEINRQREQQLIQHIQQK